jgi:hypothetical protein
MREGAGGEDMLLNAKVCNLVNTKARTHHPIIFREAPLPGLDPGESPRRFKSKCHHTEGFPTREEAMTEARRLAAIPEISGEVVDIDMEWNGEGIPALVTYF